MAKRTFEGDAIAGSTARIRKVGDGLEDALKVDALEWHRGDEVYFVGRGKVRTVAFPPEKKDSDKVVREHIIDATETTIVAEAVAAPILEADRERVEKLMEELAGVTRLPGTETP